MTSPYLIFAIVYNVPFMIILVAFFFFTVTVFPFGIDPLFSPLSLRIHRLDAMTFAVTVTVLSFAEDSFLTSYGGLPYPAILP